MCESCAILHGGHGQGAKSVPLLSYMEARATLFAAFKLPKPLVTPVRMFVFTQVVLCRSAATTRAAEGRAACAETARRKYQGRDPCTVDACAARVTVRNGRFEMVGHH